MKLRWCTDIFAFLSGLWFCSWNVARGDVALNLETFDHAWRVIYENHYDTNFNGVDWLKAREDFRPRAAAAADRGALADCMQEMLDLLGQSHLKVMGLDAVRALEPGEAGGGEGDVGLQLRRIEGQMTVTELTEGGPAARAGIQPGWVVASIGERGLTELIERLGREWNDRGFDFLAWQASMKRLGGAPGTEIGLRCLDGGDEEVTVRLKRGPPAGIPVKLGHFPTVHAWVRHQPLVTPQQRRAGWIRFNLWMIPVAGQLDAAVDEFRGAAGIILDLRGNVGGVAAMIMGQAGHFLDERVSLGTMRMRSNDLHLFANPRRVNPAGEVVAPYPGPLAILVDEITASAAEIFAGGLQELGRARIFGQRTSGQALPALFEKLPNGDLLYYVVADFVTPSNVRLEGRGVLPDDTIAVTRAHLLDGRDPVLERALRWIDERREAETAKTLDKPEGISDKSPRDLLPTP